MEIPKIAISLQPLSERKSPIWCGSSVWLECRPVTPEVESSSLFRTAKCLRIFRGIFCFCRGSATAILLVFRWSHEQPGSANLQYPDVEDYLSLSLHPCFLRYCSTPAFFLSFNPCFLRTRPTLASLPFVKNDASLNLLIHSSFIKNES